MIDCFKHQSNDFVQLMTENLQKVGLSYWSSYLDSYFFREHRQQTIENEPELDSILRIEKTPLFSEKEFDKVWCRWKDPNGTTSTVETWHMRATLEKNPKYKEAISQYAQKQGRIEDPNHPYNLHFSCWQKALEAMFLRRDREKTLHLEPKLKAIVATEK